MRAVGSPAPSIPQMCRLQGSRFVASRDWAKSAIALKHESTERRLSGPELDHAETALVRHRKTLWDRLYKLLSFEPARRLAISECFSLQNTSWSMAILAWNRPSVQRIGIAA